jgi:acyl-CoA synthetase (AMP-forming)/AMP-acid ligase II
VLKADCEKNPGDKLNLQHEILLVCREALPRHKVPATIKVVPSLAVAETGKLLRTHE